MTGGGILCGFERRTELLKVFQDLPTYLIEQARGAGVSVIFAALGALFVAGALALSRCAGILSPRFIHKNNSIGKGYPFPSTVILMIFASAKLLTFYRKNEPQVHFFRSG